MFIFIRHILLSVLVILLGVAGFGSPGLSSNAIAGELIPEVSVADRALLDYINQARQDPLKMAEAVGLKRGKVIADMPEMEETLRNGLPPLELDRRLCQAAAGHARDMRENGYYDYISPDGQNIADRQVAAGYMPAESGEALGLMVFNNFIPAEVAVFQLFANIYRDELTPERAAQGKVLNEGFNEIGVSVVAGQFSSQGLSGNVYIAVCDFGTESDPTGQMVLNLINQARAHPFEAAAVYFNAKCFSPGLLDLLEDARAPLSWHPALYESASEHAWDMLEKGYLSRSSKDGRTPAMRMADAGYEVAVSDASIARITGCYSGLDNCNVLARRFFNQIFRNTLFRPETHGSFLNPSLDEIGIGTAAGSCPDLAGICSDSVELMAVDYGTRKNVRKTGVSGVVFRDLNCNGLYDAGEGLTGVRIRVTIKGAGEEAIDECFTSSTGRYEYIGPAGSYQVTAFDSEKNDQTTRRIELGADQKKWLALPFSGPTN